MRTHPHKHSRQQTRSLANPTVFTSPADAPAPERRSLTPGWGQQGLVTCPTCGAEVTTRLVTHSMTSRYGDVPLGERVIGPHRHGGGKYSARRGDSLCAAAGTQPEEEA